MMIALTLSLAYSLISMYVLRTSLTEVFIFAVLTGVWVQYLSGLVTELAKVHANQETENLANMMSGPATTGKSYVSRQFKNLYPSPHTLATMELMRLYKHLAVRIGLFVIPCLASAGYHGTTIPLHGVTIAMCITSYLYASHKTGFSNASLA